MVTSNIKYSLSLTENHQLKAADKLITSLRQKIGELESYIEELEYDKQKLQKENKQLIGTNKNLLNNIEQLKLKYRDDKQEFINSDPIYQSCIEKIDNVMKKVTNTIEQNDRLIMEIIKLKNGN